MKQTNAIIIMDGFAVSAETEGNAIAKSGTPKLGALMRKYPHTLLGAGGLSVGLPDSFMGNSEVGHTNIGAGRIVYQYFTMINKAITDGEFQKNPAIMRAIENAKQNRKKLHLLGLLSDGGVHSHIEHLLELLRLCKAHGLKEVYIHAFTDGRDVPPGSTTKYINELEEFIRREKIGKIASLCGRYYAMDRDRHYERVEPAYRLLTEGKGEKFDTASEAAVYMLSSGLTDEFFTPAAVKCGKFIEDGDSVIFMNFRSDRAKQLTAALTEQNFTYFAVSRLNLTYVCMTNYDEKLRNVLIAFQPQNLNNTLSEYLSQKGLKQFHIAETEKYAHVTKFFNANSEQKHEGEDWILIDSPAVATFDLCPEMSAYLITRRAEKEIESGKYDALILNFANCDMVGHTGDFDAAVKAVAVVDECVDRIVSAIIKTGGTALITADHGNAEKMLADGKPFTAHTTNKVPFILAGEAYKNAALYDDGILADIAPTFLSVAGLPAPTEMTGKSLIK